jgi:hypothetical protein
MTNVILSIPGDPEPSLHQLMAVSALIISAEKLIASGDLPFEEEQSLRLLLPRVYQAFGLASPAERTQPLEAVA